ncbi:cytochrome c oxidase subunit 2A [Effusibacillus lacus]|uniref:Subunit I/II of b(O/a)3-type cytochrome C oxidase n=1 Tax=Effusibacillus lacus TaxID=1348429 RepID=A0A292YJ58_9BACL|nr:cytochrome c oxidase subunit 2A [Effusibacillus lacus]TCS74639.1 cytochrome c oxidase subunit IIa family protein [Effusibacillus lacus]GAX88510.1 subunit I/II of b(o/a)3-type cytochrome C oxidase [Effusibacillus lacus]
MSETTPRITNPTSPQSGTEEKEPSLKGTFASVMLLGTFIALSWLGVFFLFLSRN